MAAAAKNLERNAEKLSTPSSQPKIKSVSQLLPSTVLSPAVFFAV